jgi:uncharacterized protein
LNFIFDTNVLISAALAKGSIPDNAFEQALEVGTILRSENVYAELKEVINRSKFDTYLRAIDRSRFLARYKTETLNVIVTHRVSLCRDPKDNMFLELALSGKANCIITSDPDLLVLNPFENIPIISPKEFLDRY